jgi:hypothetical protein
MSVISFAILEARWPNLADSDDLLNRADFRPIAKEAWTAGQGGTSAILRDAGIPEIPGGWAGGTIWYIGWFIPDKPGTNEMNAATDPKFTNTGAGGLKFRLRSDSPAIDRGAVIPGVTDGLVGSAPDIGAYEYGGEEWVAGCTQSEKISPASASGRKEAKGFKREFPQSAQ